MRTISILATFAFILVSCGHSSNLRSGFVDQSGVFLACEAEKLPQEVISEIGNYTLVKNEGTDDLFSIFWTSKCVFSLEHSASGYARKFESAHQPDLGSNFSAALAGKLGYVRVANKDFPKFVRSKRLARRAGQSALEGCKRLDLDIQSDACAEFAIKYLVKNTANLTFEHPELGFHTVSLFERNYEVD